MNSILDINKIKDKIEEKIKEVTDGTVSIDSILEGQIKVDGNDYVDKAVVLLNDKLATTGLNDIDLPELKTDFEKSIACGIVLPGEVDVHDGSVKGLATFARLGEAQITINALQNPMISVKASVGIKEAAVGYMGTINLFCFGGPPISITGIVSDASLNIDLQVDRNLSIAVHRFDVTKNGNVNLDFGDMSPFDFISDLISEDLKTKIKNSMLEYLEKSVKEILEQIISKLPIHI